MKKNYLLIFICLIATLGFTQIQEELTAKEIDRIGFEMSNLIEDFPEDQKLVDSSSVYFGTLLGEDGFFVCLFYAKSDSTFLRSKIILLPKEEEPYRCKRPSCFFNNGMIVCECIWMRGITFVQKYKVLNGQIFYQESYQYDLNKAVYEQAEAARKNDDPIKYCNAFSKAQYYSREMNTRGLESLNWAYKKAMNLHELANFKGAANIMKSLDACWIAQCENLSPEFPDEVIEAWGNTTLFYLKAQQFNDCVNLCERLIKLFPSDAKIYLNYGDALFELNNNSYSKAYLKYTELMRSNGKEADIPSRVFSRIKG